jgi:hypothetical protein
MLDFDQLQEAVAAAKQQFGQLCKKHPGLNAKLPSGQPVSYLVFSLSGGQTGINSSPMQILREFPAMVVDDGNKTAALDLLSRLEKSGSDATVVPGIARLKDQMDQLAAQLKYDEKCQVEIRFNDLSFDLIWKLQKDELVDRDLTPRTKASIRIILGTLDQFDGTHQE